MKRLLCLMLILCLCGAPALAQTDAPVLLMPMDFGGAEAVAELAPSGKLSYGAMNAMDGALDTCWAYNQKQDPGATITFFVEGESVAINGMELTLGYAKSEDIYLANNRLKTVKITLSDGYTQQAELPQSDDYQALWRVPFGGTYDVEWVRLEVLEVYPGAKYDDTCISEVSFYTEVSEEELAYAE